MIASKTQHGVRDWGVKARRKGDAVVVTIKIGTYLHSRVNLSVAAWPKNNWDKEQAAIKAMAEAIGVPYLDWDSCELDRIPHEVVKAMDEVCNV
jgi:hypothetical protein